MKILKKLKQWIPAKTCLEFSEPHSCLTYNSDFTDEMHESIIDDLMDERCDTLKNGLVK